MAYLVCIPTPELVTRENCEKIHNILARVSDTYRINIVPEPVKKKQGTSPDYYKKYRIYKEITEGGNEAYLTPEEEKMILSVCRDEEEEALMKACAYAYQYPAFITVKAFREDHREKSVMGTAAETGQKEETKQKERNTRSKDGNPKDADAKGGNPRNTKNVNQNNHANQKKR